MLLRKKPAMPANVEIKAKLRNREKVLETAKTLSGGNGKRSCTKRDDFMDTLAGTVLVQEDTFFNCPNGRLKVRLC